MKRIFAGTAAGLLVAVLLFPVKAGAVSARSCCVLDAVSGRTLFEKEADRRSLIASTTKIMTALVALEHCTMDELVPVTAAPAAVGTFSKHRPPVRISLPTAVRYGSAVRLPRH